MVRSPMCGRSGDAGTLAARDAGARPVRPGRRVLARWPAAGQLGLCGHIGGAGDRGGGWPGNRGHRAWSRSAGQRVMLIVWTAMLLRGLGSGLCDTAMATTRALPVLVALMVMVNSGEAPLASEASLQVNTLP